MVHRIEHINWSALMCPLYLTSLEIVTPEMDYPEGDSVAGGDGIFQSKKSDER